VKEGILLTISWRGTKEMETETMEKTKEEQIEEARKRLKQAEIGGYYIQAFIAKIELRELL